MNSLLSLTLKDFNHLLASDEPAPGGGSTAALCGLLGTALTMMVVNLSIGKRFYKELDEQIKNRFMKDYETIKSLNSELAYLVDEDTEAFNLFMKALKMNKETEEEKAKRSEALQKASIYALEVPLKVAKKTLQILEHQRTIAQHGNKNAVSDVGVGAVLALAAIEGAALNVKINLPGIEDENVKKNALKDIENYQQNGLKLKEEIMDIVNKRIGAM